jgi:hypothetical protein
MSTKHVLVAATLAATVGLTLIPPPAHAFLAALGRGAAVLTRGATTVVKSPTGKTLAVGGGAAAAGAYGMHVYANMDKEAGSAPPSEVRDQPISATPPGPTGAQLFSSRPLGNPNWAHR